MLLLVLLVLLMLLVLLLLLVLILRACRYESNVEKLSALREAAQGAGGGSTTRKEMARALGQADFLAGGEDTPPASTVLCAVRREVH